MSRTLTVHLERPVASVRMSDPAGDGKSGALYVESQQVISPEAVRGQESQKGEVSFLFGALKSAVDKLNQFYDKIFAEHKKEIAKLSVEIARKILVQKVKDGDYEIEKIVREALQNAPTHQDVAVHLNPEDLVQCQKTQKDEPQGMLSGIKFVADPNIGRAECILESPKGTIESLIEANLERIGRALEKAE